MSPTKEDHLGMVIYEEAQEQFRNHCPSLFKSILVHGNFTVTSYYVILIECQYRLYAMSNHKIRNNPSIISKADEKGTKEADEHVVVLWLSI